MHVYAVVILNPTRSSVPISMHAFNNRSRAIFWPWVRRRCVVCLVRCHSNATRAHSWQGAHYYCAQDAVFAATAASHARRAAWRCVHCAVFIRPSTAQHTYAASSAKCTYTHDTSSRTRSRAAKMTYKWLFFHTHMSLCCVLCIRVFHANHYAYCCSRAKLAGWLFCQNSRTHLIYCVQGTTAEALRFFLLTGFHSRITEVQPHHPPFFTPIF